MHHRRPLRPSRTAATLAAIGALAYITEGAINLRAPQPDNHWHAAGYAVEIAFAIALLATIPLVPLLSAQGSRVAQNAARIAQGGFGAMLVDAIASTAAGGDVLGPVFLLGLLAALGGLLVLALSQARSRPVRWWSGPVVLACVLAGMALGNHGGGMLIGAAWGLVGIGLRPRTVANAGRRMIVSATLTALVLAGAGVATASAAAPQLPVASDGTSISAPRTLPGGPVSVVATVTGKAPDRTLSIVRLEPGVTVPEAFARVVAHHGNPDYLAGKAAIVLDIQADRGVTRADVTLTPGRYVALDSTGGNPSTWPRTPFTVTAPATSATALPHPGATIDMIDFAYRGATTLHVGELVRYTNSGFVTHMAFGIRVADMAAARRVTAALEAGDDRAAFKLARAEYAFAGALSPGATQEQAVATPAGVYVLACFMTSQDGSEHTKLGMLRTIVVLR